MVKKQLSYYYISTLGLFTLATLLRGWYTDIVFVSFWVGGAIGAILPDVDHLIYIYFLRPQELTSQRAVSLLKQKKIAATFDLLYRTQTERNNLIFHSSMFQVIFFVLALLVVTSSGSLFGRGLVLAFLLHLAIDQYIDMQTIGLALWFRDFPVRLTKKQEPLYWLATISSILILALVF